MQCSYTKSILNNLKLLKFVWCCWLGQRNHQDTVPKLTALYSTKSNSND